MCASPDIGHRAASARMRVDNRERASVRTAYVSGVAQYNPALAWLSYDAAICLFRDLSLVLETSNPGKEHTKQVGIQKKADEHPEVSTSPLHEPERS